MSPTSEPKTVRRLEKHHLRLFLRHTRTLLRSARDASMTRPFRPSDAICEQHGERRASATGSLRREPG